MSTTANISSLLRFYATKQDSAFVNYRDFCDYVKKYAEHHVEEQADLVKYLGNPESEVDRELAELEKKQQAFSQEPAPGKRIILVMTYYSVKFAQVYKELSVNPSIPFPSLSDLPKQIPASVIDKENATDLFPKLFVEQDLKSASLYCVLLPHDASALLFPACVPISILTGAAISKIKAALGKEEFHDYFLKKLRTANQGKELSVQNFYTTFLSKQIGTSDIIDYSEDYFYFWNQLCYFIRQDFEKVKDLTMEDENLLQAVTISEIQMIYLKTKMHQNQIREAALKELGEAFLKPPYFFSMDSILKMTDSHGEKLYGQYSESDLKKYLERMTSESEKSELPKLLVFKTESGTRYFIDKSKVFPLVTRLCNEAHDEISKDITERWSASLLEFEHLPEMRDPAKFNDRVKEEVRIKSPILYTLLNATFLTLLNFEQQNDADSGSNRLFINGHLLPYSDLLMLSSSSIYSTARLMLPFWYSIPFISSIIAFFKKKPAKKAKTAKRPVEQRKTPHPVKQMTKQEELSAAAKTVESSYVPEGSTIDRELDSYEKQWNKMITPETHTQLTEDVNTLIRDYLRKVLHTISASSFTTDRIETLAQALVNTPNLKKIQETEALTMYVQLYMIRLLENT